MEFRDRDRLSMAEEEAADAAMRRLLTHYGQPTTAPPPADLAARIVARLPDKPPAAVIAETRQQRRRSRVVSGVALGAIVLLALLGMWGIFFESSGPAQLVGGMTSVFGEAMLVLVLAAKPLVHLVLAPGLPLLAFAVLGLGGAMWLWWYLVQMPSLPQAHNA